MTNTEQARELLKRAFPFTEMTTKYIARYNTQSGKELALERERTDALYIWLQKYDADIEGVSIRNEKFPGQPYDRKQTRNSNLNDKNTQKLKLGNKAWYVKVENLSALEALIGWYKGI